MKKLFAVLVLFVMVICQTCTFADTYVRGYYRKNGTYVQPHYRTNANSTRLDNYSTRGNINPYTGKVGTKDPYVPRNNSSYSSNRYRSNY